MFGVGINLDSTLCPSSLSGQRAAAVSSAVSEPWVGRSAVYWLESRPSEGGRIALVQWRNGTRKEVTPAPFSVRSRMNEYGGGAYAIGHDGIWFVNEADQALCWACADGVRRVICGDGRLFGDLTWDGWRRRLICVSEAVEANRVVQQLVGVKLTGNLEVLVSGADFYSAPRVSPDGKRLVWLEWQNPQMPWDATRLFQSTISENGFVTGACCMAGTSQEEALCQPEWSPDGFLWVVSDRTDWWNLYRVGRDGLTPVWQRAAECARPAFAFAQRSYAFPPEGGIFLAQTSGGLWQCMELEDKQRTPKGLESLTEIVGVHAGPVGTAVAGGSPESSASLYFRRTGEKRFNCLTDQQALGEGLASSLTPIPLEFQTAGEIHSHALYYPPMLTKELKGSARPIRVRCHGGPTGAAQTLFDPRILFWTTRGFGVVELNYRGSTGYGRKYRRSIYGSWGVVDVQDAHALAALLRRWSSVDPKRMVITGASAGGLTALMSLMGKACPYAAGVSQYGVTDLVSLAGSAIGFEAYYGEHLIGPWSATAAKYRERSPLSHVGELLRPVLFLQGTEDPVVPPEQSASMARAMAQRGVTVALEFFAGERHGFRNPDSIARALELELSFYVKVLKLNTSERLPEVHFLSSRARG